MNTINAKFNKLTRELNLDYLENIFTIASRFKNIDSFNKIKETKEGKSIEFIFNRPNNQYYVDSQVLTINNITDKTSLTISWLVNHVALEEMNNFDNSRSVGMNIAYQFPNQDMLVVKYKSTATSDTLETFRKHKFMINEIEYCNSQMKWNYHVDFKKCYFSLGKTSIGIYADDCNSNISKVIMHSKNIDREFDFDLSTDSQLPINDCTEYSCSYQELLSFDVNEEQKKLKLALNEIKRKLNHITVSALNLEPLYRSLDDIESIKNDYQLVVNLFFKEFFEILNQSIKNTTNNAFDLELLKELYKIINTIIQERKAELYNEQKNGKKKSLSLFKRK